MKLSLLIFVLCFVPFQIVAKQPTQSADSLSLTNKMDYFFFQTTGNPDFLLGDAALQAIKLSANLSGYRLDEIEVTITVTDKKEKSRSKRRTSFRRTKKPKVKKFE